MKNNTEDTSSQQEVKNENENVNANNKKSGKRIVRDILWFVAGAVVGCGGTLLYNKSRSGKGTEEPKPQTQSQQYNNNTGNNRPFNGNNGQR